MPYSELFPMGIGVNSLGTDLDGVFDYEDVIIEPYDLFGTYPFSGTYNNFYYNLSSEILNVYDTIVGYLIYVNSTDDIPVNQTAITFILEEEPGCEEIIENMTTASGCILINNESKTYCYQNASQNTFPVVRVDECDSNLTKILNELSNETGFMVDNVYNNETMVFTYNFSNNPFGPSDNWIGLVSRTAPSDPESYDSDYNMSGAYYDFVRLWNQQAVWKIFNFGPDPLYEECEGFILYDFQDSDMHFMTHAVRGWSWFSDGFSNRWFFPTFSINNSVGEWLNDHHDTTTLSGFIDQNFKKQTLTAPGVESYNVVGYRNISQSPGDGIVVLSNRIDGWWGETPGDSGAGCALLLGIAKYFHEYDITPKYNLTFLFTTGEEYGMRGAQHYNDGHPDEENNFTRFIGFDQLCFNYTLADHSLNTSIGVQNEDDIKIINVIANDTDYVGRTGYGLDISIPDSYGSEDRIWKDRCPTIGFGKDNDSSWDGYHRSGMNYNSGDSLGNTDRNDLNLTFELAWDIIKYFTVDPNCRFDSISYESYDSTDGLMKDSIRTTFTVKSILPSDLARLNVSLVDSSTQETVDWSIIDYSINSTGADNEVSFTMPEGISDGDYNLTFKLYNSTGRINEIVGIGDNNVNQTVTSPGFRLHRYPSLGSNRVGTLTNSVEDIITGSYFKMKGHGEAENITAYVYGKGIYPADPTYKCMIYRLNDSSLIGTTEELKPGSIGWKTFSFSEPKPVLKDNVNYVLTVWGDNTTELYYHSAGTELIGKKGWETYGTPPNPADFILTQTREWSVFCAFTPETELPEISNVTALPNTEGFGQDITINADVKDNLTGIDLVTVNISHPDDSTGNFTMSNTENDTYQYTFSDTWLVGQYNYTIWAKDNSSNLNSSSGYSFNVSANAIIKVQTLQDTYGSGEDINLTDPPGEGGGTTGILGNPGLPDWQEVAVSEDEDFIIVDNGDGMVWKFAKGMAGYDEIWHNGFQVVANEQWVLEYLHNSNWMQRGIPQSVSYEQPEPHHVIVTREFTDYMGTEFNISYEFVGGYRTKIKFDGYIGESDEYRIVWKASGINTDYIEHDGNANKARCWNNGEEAFVFDYNDVYDSFGNITSVEIEQSGGNHKCDQYFYIGELDEGLFELDPNFGYESQGGSGLMINNAIRGSWFECPDDGMAESITAYITHVGLGSGSTDGKCAIYAYQNDSNGTYLVGETEEVEISSSGWKTFNFVNETQFAGGTKYFLTAWSSQVTKIQDILAYTTETDKGIAKTSTTYDSWPEPLTDEVGVNHKYSIYCTYNASPVFSTPSPANLSDGISRYPALHVDVNDTDGDNMNLTFLSNESGSWSSFGSVKIGSDNKFGNSQAGNDGYNTVNDEIRGTWFTCPADGTADSVHMYTMVYGGAVGYPTHMKAALYYGSNMTKLAETEEGSYEGMIGEPFWYELSFDTPPLLTAGEQYYVVLWGDTIHRLYYESLSGFNRSISKSLTYGSWNNTLDNVSCVTGKMHDIYVEYTTTSTLNGTYYMDNLDMGDVGSTYFWNVSVDDGTNTVVSDTYQFLMGNQSKIKNTGSTNLSGYLLMQVQFYNETLEGWVVDNDTINETTTRTINSGDQLALDLIFNGNVTTSNLVNGDGTYRVYASFRDPDGDVLICDDEYLLEAWWEFEVDTS